MSRKEKTQTVTVSCGEVAGRYRGGRHFAYGSHAYTLTAAQVAAVQADPLLALATADDEADAAASQMAAQLEKMEAASLADLLDDVAAAYNAKAPAGRYATISFGDRPEAETPAPARRRGRAARQDAGQGKGAQEPAEARQGASQGQEAPPADKPADASAADTPKPAEGTPDADALPDGFPYADALAALTLVEVRAARDAGTLAGLPGMSAVSAGEVSDALDALGEV